MSDPRVVLGAPTFNHADEAREAFESILQQTCRDFALVVVDDCSTDGTYEIAEEYARHDSRVSCHRNARRLGMIENWRRAFFLSVEQFPGAKCFAWVSDHDLWHPRWLSVLVQELERHPDAVLAYPLNKKLYPDGSPVDRKPWYFDTADTASPATRLRRAGWNMSAGNMIYGLYRVGPLERAGVFRRVLVPDRLLLSELAVQGCFRQAPEVLWFRRWYGRIFSLSRQRASFFPNGRPLYAYVPWWLCHTVAFGWHLVGRGSARPAVGRWRAVGLTLQHGGVACVLHAVQSVRQVRLTIVERAPRMRGLVRRIMGAVSAAPRRGAGAGKTMERQVRKRLKTLVDESIRIPGVAFLKAVRAIPFVKSRAIPWLIREELHQVPAASAVVALTKELRRVAESGKPIVVGPWLSEVGFELLYWIPFLNWVTETFGLERQRLIVVSRGGAGAWYRDFCDRSVDVFDIYSVDEYRQRNDARWQDGGNQKQFEMSEFDHEIVDTVKARLRERDVAMLHPALMYQLFRFYWFEKGSISLIHEHCRYRRLPVPAPPPVDLPKDYVAVRFYFRPSFPDTSENRAFVQRVIQAITKRLPIVMLNPGLRVDDHEDYAPADGERIHRIADGLDASRNLAVQDSVIANAQAFVGTYGGLAYLGPFHGVPSVSFYSHHTELVLAHLDQTERMCRATGATMSAVSVEAAGWLEMVLGQGGPIHGTSVLDTNGPVG